MRQAEEGTRHSWLEDVAAGLTGLILVTLGLTLLSKATLLTGGTTGLALLVQYASGAPFWLAFFVINLPFYALSAWQLGWKLTLRTFLAVLAVSAMMRFLPSWIGVSDIRTAYAAGAGGVLCGVGMLILFRHRTSLGGVNLLALFAQEKFGWRAGYVQLAIDAAILAASLLVIDAGQFIASLAGIAAVNLVLAVNHRPDRYRGFS